MYDAFLSHASVNKDDARRVCHALRTAKLRVFYSPDSLKHGKDFYEELDQAVRDSRSLLLLLSGPALGSRYVQAEITLAAKLEIPIIPVYLSRLEIPELHPISIHVQRLHRIDLYGDFDIAVEDMVTAIGPSDRFGEKGGLPVDTLDKKLPENAPALDTTPRPTPPPRPAPAPTPASSDLHTPSISPAPEPASQPKPKPKAHADNAIAARSPEPAPRKPKWNVDPEKLVENLLRDVDRGDRDAAYFLSRLYSAGLYVDPDEERAVRYLQLSARGNRGKPEAMHDLAECYRLAKGVARNPRKAVKLHEDAARRGFAPSFYRLGRIYQQGKIASKDHARAYRRFAVAAEGGYAPAKFRVSEALLAGRGVDQDTARAFELAMEAVEEHYPPALNLVGRFYRKGIHVEQSDEVACDWYQKAVDQGSPEGAYNLGTMYRRGLGRPRDELLARRYIEVSQRLLSGADPRQALRDSSILIETEERDA